MIKHQSRNGIANDWREIVYTYVAQIPPASVCTYGEIAEYLGLTARMVGSAMHVCPPDLPWHRVVGSGGRLATARRSPELAQQQLQMLLDEGVPVRNLRVVLPE